MRAARAIGVFAAAALGALGAPVPAAAQAATADVSIADVVVPDWRPTPSTVQFWLVVVNAGPDAAASTLRVALPDGVDAVAGTAQQWTAGPDQGAGASCAVAAAPYQVVCSLGTVPAGGAAGVNVIIANRALPAGSGAQLAASVSTDAADPVPANNAAVVPVTFTGGPLGAGPADLHTSLQPWEPWGSSVSEVLATIANDGATPAEGVRVVARVPEGVGVRARFGSLESESGVGGGALPPCEPSADRRTVTCTLVEPLRIDQRVHLSLLVVNTGLAAGSTTSLRVEASWTGTDADPADDTADVSIGFAGGPVAFDAADVSVVNNALPPGWTQPVDGVANAAVVVSSRGPAPASDVELTIEAPAGVRLAATDDAPFTEPATCAAVQPDLLRCRVEGVMERSAPRYVPFAAINVGLPAGASAELRATVRHGEADPDTSNDAVAIPVTFNGAPVPTDPDRPSADLVADNGDAAEVAFEEPMVAFSWSIASRGPDRGGPLSVVVQLGPGLTYRRGYLDAFRATCAAGTEAATVVCTAEAAPPPGRPMALHLFAAFDGSPPRARYEAEAFVAGALFDPNTANNRARARLTLSADGAEPSVTVAGTSVTAAAPLPATGGSADRLPVLGAAAIAAGLALAGVAISRRRPSGARPA